MNDLEALSTFFTKKTPEFKHIQRIHFVGVGGVGMSGLAEIFHNEGYGVSGSDIALGSNIKHLRDLGITIRLAHRAENVKGADIVVFSAAVDEHNVELQAAKAQRIPVVPRAAMLAELMRNRDGIAIAGTHGKTTTTSLIANMLSSSGLDPTFIIGGKLSSTDSNARLGSSRYLVTEADESDASFLHLQPLIAVVTNIDVDHMQTYNHDVAQLHAAFEQFLHRLPISGVAVLCLDDPGIQAIYRNIQRKTVTYGIKSDADVRAINLKCQGLQTFFTVQCKEKELSFDVCLNLPGEHNVLNALATIVVALELCIDPENIQLALKKFQGIDRRFQVHGAYPLARGHALLIDDYGHHPREIQATLQAMRTAWPKRRLVVVYQLHRYTRTHDLYEDFAEVLSKVDVLIMLEVYSAGETAIVGADARSLCNTVRQRGQVDPIFVAKKNNLHQALAPIVQDGDILLFQGAGDIGQLVKRFADKTVKLENIQ